MFFVSLQIKTPKNNSNNNALRNDANGNNTGRASNMFIGDEDLKGPNTSVLFKNVNPKISQAARESCQQVLPGHERPSQVEKSESNELFMGYADNPRWMKSYEEMP